MHLADAFIQKDLGYTFFISMFVPCELNQRNALPLSHRDIWLSLQKDFSASSVHWKPSTFFLVRAVSGAAIALKFQMNFR